MPELEADFRSDQQIATDFLAYLHSECSDHCVYQIEPTRLRGGADARLYRYKLLGEEPRVLRVLRPAHQAEELVYHQFVHQTLKQQGLKAPAIQRVCGDPSVLGGVFEVMDLVPGQPLAVQPPEIHASVLGVSMARMHELDVKHIVETFRRVGISDEHFLFPAALHRVFALFEQKTPWAAELIGWLRDHLSFESKDLSVIHGDYHGYNVMFEQGAVTGVLDWSFAVADPAVDLANMMNAYLVFAHQLYPGMSPRFCEQIVDGVFRAYQAIRPLNHLRIQAFRVLQLLGALSAATGPEFMRRSESKCDYVAFIEQTTGLKLLLRA